MKKRRFYFHFRSPYSWIGANWMESLPSRENVEYVPFWEIDGRSRLMLSEKGGEHSYVAMSKAKHLYILQDIKRITTRLGLELRWPPSPENQHWEVPHLAYIYARREGRNRMFFERVHQARWNQGRDICDPKTISELAESCGLDSERCSHAWEDESIREEGVLELMKAHEDGVFGIPFFVHGYNRFWGIDRFDLFARSLEKETPGAVPWVSRNPPLYETDHPGGCG